MTAKYRKGVCSALLQTRRSHWPDTMTPRLSVSNFVSCIYAIEPPCTERHAGWCERTVIQQIGGLLLHFLRKHFPFSHLLFYPYLL